MENETVSQDETPRPTDLASSTKNSILLSGSPQCVTQPCRKPHHQLFISRPARMAWATQHGLMYGTFCESWHRTTGVKSPFFKDLDWQSARPPSLTRMPPHCRPVCTYIHLMISAFTLYEVLLCTTRSDKDPPTTQTGGSSHPLPTRT